MQQLFSNNAETELAAPLTAISVSMQVADASQLKALSTDQYFLLTLVEEGANSIETDWEIVKVTAIKGNVLTIERGQEDTDARVWTEGSKVSLRLTAGTLDKLRDDAAPVGHVDDYSNPHMTTKYQIGLWDVDNTSDMDKPVSTAQAAADAAVLSAAATDATAKANAAQAAAIAASTPISHAGSAGTAHGAATPSVSGFMSAADKTKLDGVATGATANATDAQLRDRSTHTGSQAISTVTGLQTALAAKLDDSQATTAGLAVLGAADVAAQRNALGLANHQLVSVDGSGNPTHATTSAVAIARLNPLGGAD